jgi:bacteriocin biosynthesis cyclodehydratase domain-containing protein
MQDNRLQVVWVGPFGKAVADDLAALQPNCYVRSPSEPLTASQLLLLAAWRPVSALCKRLNLLSHDWRIPFIPLIAESATLRLGPVVIPGAGACWECFVTRYAQHDRHTEERSALWRYYDAHPDDGPKGYLRPLAMMAAVRLSQVIDAVESGGLSGGYMWSLNIPRRQSLSSTVVPVHGCACRVAPTDSESRRFAEMRDSLKCLWTPEHSSRNPKQ